MTAGTDIHSIDNRDVVAGVGLEKEIFSIEELIEEIKCNRITIAPVQKFEEIKKLELDGNIELDVFELSNDGIKKTNSYFAERNHP